MYETDGDIDSIVKVVHPLKECSKQIYLRIDGKSGFESRCKMNNIVDNTKCDHNGWYIASNVSH